MSSDCTALIAVLSDAHGTFADAGVEDAEAAASTLCDHEAQPSQGRGREGLPARPGRVTMRRQYLHCSVPSHGTPLITGLRAGPAPSSRR